MSASSAHLRLVPAPPLAAPLTDHVAAQADIVVSVDQHWLRFYGSRAQLEAEGFVPPDAKWPELATRVSWESGRYEFRLRRTRPEGMKGPKKLWMEGDYWCLDLDVKGRDYDWYQKQFIYEKARALAVEIYRHSPQGQREWFAHCDRYRGARNDTAFQAVMDKFIWPRKPGRKPKAASAFSQRERA
ncbi:hypothetical protein PEC18_11730 [Paucibacter sp. O1-1]|nr:hypothetical protein [Paucibacter sp. O1-1]MDA3826493.1 hypothetical protein [Paucibacter sp. O1-1]